MGGIVYPIMLNQLINKTNVGFAWGIRTTAFLSLGLLCVANILVTPVPLHLRQVGNIAAKPNMKAIFGDIAFMLAVLG